MSKYRMTTRRKEELEDKLSYLKNEKLKEIHDNIKYYRSFCNFTEDTPFDETLDKQFEIQEEIREIETVLAQAEIISPEQTQTEVKLGNEVTFLDLDSDEKDVYTLVNPVEANPLKQYISIKSPIGEALLNHKLNDIVSIDIPSGTLKVKIIDIH